MSHMTTKDWWLIKNGKLETPMDPVNSTYPITSKEHMGPLLRQRINEARDAIQEEFKCNNVQMWLFGSQLRGRSATGKPDIDVYWYSPSVDRHTNFKQFERKKINVLHKLPFKIDLNYMNRQGKPGSVRVI